jgi:transcriptional regulator with XRE-family HTH domain
METNLDIRTFRFTRKWTQQRLAEELGVNTSTVWRWEKDGAGVNGVVQQAIMRLAEQYPPVREFAA